LLFQDDGGHTVRYAPYVRTPLIRCVPMLVLNRTKLFSLHLVSRRIAGFIT
jgi:hypothetical protein